MNSSLRNSTLVDGLLAVLAAAAVLILTHTGPGLANDTSRLATAEALVEQGTFAIDGTHFEYTVDKIRVDGRFYSDKPPILSLYLAALYLLASTLFGWTIEADLPTVYYVLSLGSSGLAFVATLLGVRRLAGALGATEVEAGFVAAGGFGTLLLPYSVVVSSHAAAAPFLTWFVVGLVANGFGGREREESSSELGTAAGFVIGGAGATAALIEPLAAVFVAPLGAAYVVEARRWRSAAVLLAGAAVPAVPHGAITYQIAGNPILANLNPAYFEYAGSMHSAENLSGVGWAHDSWREFLFYAYHSLVGYRGWVMYNVPAAVGAGCAVWAFIGGVRRWMAGAVVAGTALFFVLTIGWSSNFSGWAYGIRWQATPAPLWLACAGFALGSGSGSVHRVARAGFAAALVLGVSSAAPGTIDPWTPSHGDEYSIVEVVSGDASYIEEHLDAAARHLEAGRPQEARYQAEHALRRNPALVPAWKIAIRASIEGENGEWLRSYRRRLRAGEGSLDAEVRDRLVSVIESALRDS